MKKLIISLLSCLVITTCFAETNIILKGEGTNKDYKIARYIAAKQIEEQYAQLPEKTLKFTSIFRTEEKPYNYLHIIYNDYIICNMTAQGRDGTGNPMYFQRKVSDWLPCDEKIENQTVKMTCVINDEIIEAVKKALIDNKNYDNEYCENHFHNEFINTVTGETKIQRGIIFGSYKYKDYFDTRGRFFTIDYGKDTWYGDHEEKLFYFGNISEDDFRKEKHLLRKMIDEED